MTRRAHRRWLVSVGLALGVSALLTAAFLLNFLQTAQLQSHDFLFKTRAEAARSTLIVAIDQRSYRELLPSYGPPVEWPRVLYAHALDQLVEAKARVVALDLLFSAPNAGDEELAASIRRAGNVILPVEAQGPKRLLPRPGVAQEFEAFLPSTASLRESAAAEGFVNVTRDPDSVVRSLPLLLQAGSENVQATALVAVARFTRRPTVVDAPPTGSEVYAAGRAIPIIEGRMLINFLGPPSDPDRGGPVSILSFVDVLNGAFDRTLVADKVVLMGFTIGGVDEHTTPSTSGSRMWGVEVLANAIETILQQRYLMPAPSGLTIALIFFFAVAAAILATILRPIASATAALAMLAFYVLLAIVLVDNGVLLNLIYPPASLVLAAGVALTYRVISEQAEQRVLRGIMERYLAPSVSQWVLQDPDRMRLGGETREMTVLFSDIRGFTALAHAMEPQALTALLNEYMTAMTTVIFSQDGVLDKYIGDAIMAFWNAPMDQPDHARRACEVALAMTTELSRLQADWARRGLPRLELGIGINSGPMVVGNMGSRQRLAYTVLGDTVNVASRLEGLSKEYGTQTVVGEATKAAAGDVFVYRFLDVVAVVGRDEPLSVYEVVGRAGDLDSARKSFLERYHQGVELYRSRQWGKAAALFTELVEEAPGDGPSVLYLRRSLDLLAAPESDEWSPVFTATTK